MTTKQHENTAKDLYWVLKLDVKICHGIDLEEQMYDTTYRIRSGR